MTDTDRVKEEAKKIIGQMPLRVSFWFLVSKLPFLSPWRRYSIFNDKISPWIVANAIRQLKEIDK